MSHIPQQNGIAERRNRILMEMTRSIMCHFDLLLTFWEEALSTTMCILNRVTKSPKNWFRMNIGVVGHLIYLI